MISSADIKVYCALNICKVFDFCMEVKKGKHSKITLRGQLSGSNRIMVTRDTPIKIAVSDDGVGEDILFQGLIQSTNIFCENGVYQIILTAAAYDIKLDKTENSRSYQDTSCTYIQIIKHTMKNHQGIVSCETPAVKTGYPVIQYKETDWQFCKRMASGMGFGVFSNPISTTPHLDLGLVETTGNASFRTDEYKVCVDETYFFAGSDKDKREFLYYLIETDKNYQIGTGTYYQGQKRYIFEKTAELVNDRLIFRYKIGGKCQFMEAKQYNEKIAGMSLDGDVVKTDKQAVYLRLAIDGQDAIGQYPYPWVPISGNIMYCMPQVGTKASLYFPDHDEKNAIAVNSIHINAGCFGFSNPQNRGLATEHGRQMQLYADQIRFSGGTAETRQTLCMDKDKLSLQVGGGRMQITGGEKVIFRAPEISMVAAQKIGQYKMKSKAEENGREIYPRGSRNPATGGTDAVFEAESGCNILSGQGILYGTEHIYYNPFPKLHYEKYEAIDTDSINMKKFVGGLLAVAVGLAVAALVICTGGLGLVAAGGVAAVALGFVAGAVTVGAGLAAVEATAKNDIANGAESSWGEYIANSLTASVSVGGALIAIMMAPHAALGGALLAEHLSAGLGVSLLGGLQLTTGIITSANLIFQINDVKMFYQEGKGLRQPTGNETYDELKKFAEIGSLFISVLGLGTCYYELSSVSRGIGNIAEIAGYQNAVEDSTLTANQKRILVKIQNVIDHNLTETDFNGTLRDLLEDPVFNKEKGNYFNHLQEMLQSYSALTKLVRRLMGCLKNPNLSDDGRRILQEGLYIANEYITRMQELFDLFGGIEQWGKK